MNMAFHMGVGMMGIPVSVGFCPGPRFSPILDFNQISMPASNRGNNAGCSDDISFGMDGSSRVLKEQFRSPFQTSLLPNVTVILLN